MPGARGEEWMSIERANKQRKDHKAKTSPEHCQAMQQGSLPNWSMSSHLPSELTCATSTQNNRSKTHRLGFFHLLGGLQSLPLLQLGLLLLERPD